MFSQPEHGPGGQLAAELKAMLPDLERRSYAVRSSATLEDSAAASFAGQHDTILGCTGLAVILDAVRTCFASFRGERAIAYRRRLGIGDGEAAIAVVVQEMVTPRVAGVAFTLDPVSGRADEVHISAAAGLGEGVVSGEAAVDRFVVSRDMQLVRSETGSVGLCLTANEAVGIARIARAIEARLGFPQDVEWAIDERGVHILQARPITAIPPRWTREESAERFPTPVTPLTWDFVEAGFHEALVASFKRMGLPAPPGKWFACFDGYIYGNQNAVELYCGRSPIAAGSLDDLRATLPQLVERFSWIQELPGEWAVTLEQFLIEIGALGTERLEGRSPSEIWAHIRRINDAGRRYFRHNIAISIGHAAVHRTLADLLRRLMPEEQAASTYDILVRPMETRTGRINRELDALAAMARDDQALADVLSRARPRSPTGAGVTGFAEFDRRLEALLGDHGHRELDFDPYHPTWAEVPWVVFEAVRARIGEPAPIMENAFARHAAAVATLQRIAANLPEDIACLLNELVRLARLYTELDDHEHYQTARLTPLLRRAVQALAASLPEGLLEDPLDLFFAREAALAEAAALDRPARWRRLAQSVAVAKQAYRTQRERTPPWSLADDGAASTGEPILNGVPGSAGRAAGAVFVVRSAADLAACPAGAIVVARAITPSWSTIFSRAAGVIAESGGPLSHGAIAAREYGIPAVMAVRGALSMFADGELVEIDGTRGLVSREMTKRPEAGRCNA